MLRRVNSTVHNQVWGVGMIEHRQKRDAELEQMNLNLERIAEALEGIYRCLKP